ncbi:hypothetical protein MTO96_020596 [Rhipicephalus appendiculatus]
MWPPCWRAPWAHESWRGMSNEPTGPRFLPRRPASCSVRPRCSLRNAQRFLLLNERACGRICCSCAATYRTDPAWAAPFLAPWSGPLIGRTQCGHVRAVSVHAAALPPATAGRSGQAIRLPMGTIRRYVGPRGVVILALRSARRMCVPLLHPRRAVVFWARGVRCSRGSHAGFSFVHLFTLGPLRATKCDARPDTAGRSCGDVSAASGLSCHLSLRFLGNGPIPWWALRVCRFRVVSSRAAP